MAIANIELICEQCGEKFAHRRECGNRKDCDRYALWAADHITLCTACKAKNHDKENADKLASALCKFGVTLPAIEGKSEKQIAYANDVRKKYLAGHTERIGKYLKVRDNMADPDRMAKFVEDCAKKGLDPQQEISRMMDQTGLGIIRILLQSNSARNIIDCVTNI